MSYTVTWTPSAEDDLAAVWVASPDRKAVTRVAHEIEHQLRYQPLRIGESRESDVSRVVISPPLAVRFEVVEDDKRVYIRGVTLSG